MQKIYRKSVGCVLINNNNLIFIAKRTDQKIANFKNSWQMPQGGVENNETLEQALFRELKEEIGTNNINIINKTSTLYYDFPTNIAQQLYKNFGTYYTGQEQIWFFCKFLGKDTDFNFNLTTNPEFDNFEWANKDTVINRCIDFKQDLYKEIFKQANQYNILI